MTAETARALAPAPSPTVKMETRNLSIRYGQKVAVKNVDLKLPEREVMALIGPSGCGKSTFLRALNRMNDLIPGASFTGQILLDGEDVLGSHLDAVELRRRVGIEHQVRLGLGVAGRHALPLVGNSFIFCRKVE